MPWRVPQILLTIKRISTTIKITIRIVVMSTILIRQLSVVTFFGLDSPLVKIVGGVQQHIEPILGNSGHTFQNIDGY